MSIYYKGTVQKGRKRGTALGFPTINIPLEGEEVSGVYVANVRVGGEEFKAAAFADTTRHLLEAHLIDASPDLYGKEVTIELLKKIREHQSFPNDEVLRAAIADDVQKTRQFFEAV